MQPAARILGFAALGLTIIPPLLFMGQTMAEPAMKNLMIAGCVLWLIFAPLFMKGGAE